MAAIAPVDPTSPDYLKLRKTVAGQVAQGYGTDPAATAPAAPDASVSPDFAQTSGGMQPAPPLMGQAPPAPSSTNIPIWSEQVPSGINTGTEPTKIADTAAPSTVTTQPVAAPQPLTPPADTTPPPAAAAAPAAPASVEDAVAANYKSLGVTPTGPGTGPTDAAYFIRRINETGGATPENLAYWMGPNGRIAKELRGEVPPEQGAAITPPNVAASLAAPTPAPAIAPITGQATVAAGKPPNSTSGSNHTPGDGTGVPGVYDWNNAGYPVDAMGQPYMGSLQNGEPNPWTTGGGTEGFPAGSAPASNGGDFQSQVRAALMARLKELGQPVDENSSGISAAVSGARDEATRASEQERTALAERFYAQGGGGLQSGAITQQIQQSGEKNAANLSGLRAMLIMQQYQQRQAELQQTLNTAVASGDAEAARQAQAAIAALQAQVNREGLGLDAAKYEAYLNQQAALAGLNG